MTDTASITAEMGTSFGRLTRWLELHRPLWSQRPFAQLPVPWEADHPDISRALRSLDTDTVEANACDPGRLDGMPLSYRQMADEAREFSSWPSLGKTDRTVDRSPPGINPRKWRQVSLFADTAVADVPSGVNRWLDWCSGKGHLGHRVHALTGLPVTCVEVDKELCRSGAKISARSGAAVTFAARDVMFVNPIDGPGDDVGILALHACGGLNQRLLRVAVESRCVFVAIAPCCYQRIPTEDYVPSSRAGRTSGLSLHRHQLRLVSFNEVVARPKRREERRREQAWRLGFDLLLRESLGRDRYTPIGSVPRDWLDLSFEQFCHRVARRKNLELQSTWSPAEFELRGSERLKTASALGLLRGLFRRPLESWLALDRMLYLEENGYRVEAGTFCGFEDTPRNLLVMARL